MSKSESKYYNTALLMNNALVELLNKKDYEFITIKEICEKAGVNRSTFYLHYESVADLLEECIDNINKKFLTYFKINTKDFVERINDFNCNEFNFITPEYLTPYLTYVRDNKIIHKTVIKHSAIMKSQQKFYALNQYIFSPIFKRFGVDTKTQSYMIAYYINGVYAIIQEWIKNDCKDDIEYIEKIIIDCVRPTISNQY
ncbi:MAG: TetR/AcrR family transcriptional regulator [Clostridia bacterium]|nr:TetR/AcrR family transcriptional regulator [Clostridia bacterium]